MKTDMIGRLAAVVGVKAACSALGRARSTHYRQIRTGDAVGPEPAATRPTRQPRALTDDERRLVLDLLDGDEFVDMAPGEVYATLLDRGTYLCSERTMYTDPGRRRSESGTTCAGDETGRSQTRTRRGWSEQHMELGYHQAPWATEMDVLLPVYDHRYLQPVCARMDGCDP